MVIKMIYCILVVIIGILLFIAGITDIRKKTVSRKFLFILMTVCLAAVLLKIVKREFGIIEAAGGTAIGFCAIGISMVSRKQIGRGDGIVISIIGLVLGIRKCLAVVSAASLLMCFAAIIILAAKKGNRNTRLAFLPALFAGYLLCGTGGY